MNSVMVHLNSDCWVSPLNIMARWAAIWRPSPRYNSETSAMAEKSPPVSQLSGLQLQDHHLRIPLSKEASAGTVFNSNHFESLPCPSWPSALLFYDHIPCIRIDNEPSTAQSECLLTYGSLDTTPYLYTAVCLHWHHRMLWCHWHPCFGRKWWEIPYF